MTSATIKIHNVETGEIIERELNATELAQQAEDASHAVAIVAAETAREAAKADLLSRLGITEDEAKLLLS